MSVSSNPGRVRRERTVHNYATLDTKGVEPAEDNILKAGKPKPARSIRSAKSTKLLTSKNTAGQSEQELQKAGEKLDQKIDDVEQRIGSNPAYVAMLYEAKHREMGEVYVTDEPVPDIDAGEQELLEMKKTYKEEQRLMEDRANLLKIRQELLDEHEVLVEQRAKVEEMLWNQKMQQKETELKLQERMLVLHEKEHKQTQRENAIKERAQKLRVKEVEVPEETEDERKNRIQGWLDEGDRKSEAEPKKDRASVKSGRTVKSRGPLASGPSMKLAAQSKRLGRLTDSERRIQELEAELKRATDKLNEQSDPHRPGDIARLARMGLVNKEDTAEEAGAVSPMDNEELGKQQLQLLSCAGCVGDKNSKLKSGKFAKSHLNIMKQEQWPHLNILRKYVKRPSFESMDFECFVAGETRVILSMTDSKEAHGRLAFLCKLAHWYCRCRDWALVRGLFEAVMEAIELGEETWLSDFTHYETMITYEKVDREKDRKKIAL